MGEALETSLALSFKLDVSWKTCPINQKASILWLISIYKYLTVPWQEEVGLRAVYLQSFWDNAAVFLKMEKFIN